MAAGSDKVLGLFILMISVSFWQVEFYSQSA